jgi:hypothetical protein
MKVLRRTAALFVQATMTLLGLTALIVLPVAALWGYWYWIGEALVDSMPSHPAIGISLEFLPLVVATMLLLSHEHHKTKDPA